MMSPPIIRVEVPHDVDHGFARCWFLSRYSMPYASEKCWPRLWLVPACSARPSPISASIAYVRRAPANFSLSVFWPKSTGIASISSEKAR